MARLGGAGDESIAEPGGNFRDAPAPAGVQILLQTALFGALLFELRVVPSTHGIHVLDVQHSVDDGSRNQRSCEIINRVPGNAEE